MDNFRFYLYQIQCKLFSSLCHINNISFIPWEVSFMIGVSWDTKRRPSHLYGQSSVPILGIPLIMIIKYSQIFKGSLIKKLNRDHPTDLTQVADMGRLLIGATLSKYEKPSRGQQRIDVCRCSMHVKDPFCRFGKEKINIAIKG